MKAIKIILLTLLLQIPFELFSTTTIEMPVGEKKESIKIIKIFKKSSIFAISLLWLPHLGIIEGVHIDKKRWLVALQV